MPARPLTQAINPSIQRSRRVCGQRTAEREDIGQGGAELDAVDVVCRFIAAEPVYHGEAMDLVQRFSRFMRTQDRARTGRRAGGMRR